MRKQDDVKRFSNKFLWYFIIVMIFLALAFSLQMTPLNQLFWVNFFTTLIMNNAFIIFMIAILLFALHIIRLQMFKRDIEKERWSNGS